MGVEANVPFRIDVQGEIADPYQLEVHYVLGVEHIQPKPFLVIVRANMFIEGFVDLFANALGLEDHVSRMNDIELHWNKGPANIVVAALRSPITIAVEKHPYRRTQSSEEDRNDSNEGNI